GDEEGVRTGMHRGSPSVIAPSPSGTAASLIPIVIGQRIGALVNRQNSCSGITKTDGRPARSIASTEQPGHIRGGCPPSQLHASGGGTPCDSGRRQSPGAAPRRPSGGRAVRPAAPHLEADPVRRAAVRGGRGGAGQDFPGSGRNPARGEQ